MKSLDDIAIKRGTDKSSRYHNYCAKYERFLPFGREDGLKVLEIGVARGSSLKMWSDFYPRSSVYGIDIDPKCWKPFRKGGRITVLNGSQNDEQFLKDVCESHGPFDLIVDDGSHNTLDQYVSFCALLDSVKAGGVYIVEDLCTSYWEEYMQDGFSMVDFLKGLVDDLNYQGVKHQNKVYRKEILLEREYTRKFQFTGMLFINSSCLIFK